MGNVIHIQMVTLHQLSLTANLNDGLQMMCIAVNLLGKTEKTRADAISLRLMCIAINS